MSQSQFLTITRYHKGNRISYSLAVRAEPNTGDRQSDTICTEDSASHGPAHPVARG